jgi:integrase
MTTQKINKRFVDTATCAGKQQLIYWDSELKGFGLRVTPTRKTYVAQSRVDGKTVRITLGLHGPLTPEQARIEAKKRLGEMAVGININKVERDARLKGITLLDAYNEYIKSRTLTENTLKDYAKAMRLGFPDWHHKTIQNINRDLIENRFNSLSKKSLAQANQIFRFLRALLNFAKEKYTSEDGEPLIPSNPCDRLTALKKWHRINRRTRYLESQQLQAWFSALDEYSLTHGDTIKDYCIFILLTGCREQEAARLTWQNVDLSNSTVTFSQTKNHRIHILPCGQWLTKILTKRKEGSKGEYVFPAQNKYGHLKYHRKNIEALNSLSGIEFTLHDLRRTFASIVNHQLSKSFSLYTIKRLLNHSGNDVTSGYIQFGIDDLREPMQLIENFVLWHVESQLEITKSFIQNLTTHELQVTNNF